MRASGVFAFAVYIAAIPSSCLCGPLQARDARGKVLTLAAPPRRIVSLTPAVTETLFAVGAGNSVVGVTTYCDFPIAARAIPKIGDYLTSMEKVIARKPDLVIASVSANGAAIRNLERLRIPVFAVDTLTVQQVLDSIRAIGLITGHGSGANEVNKRMKAAISAVRKRVSAAAVRPRTLIVVDVNTPWVAGANTYMDDLVAIAGGVNVARNAGSGWRAYSAEKVVVQMPEVILVADRNPNRLRRLPGWSRIPAVVNNRIHGNLPIAFVRPGPRLTAAIEHIARLLHPRLYATDL